jgi:hypothetical protein
MRWRQSLSPFGATSLQHKASVLAGHASPEAVCLCASSVVRLKSALRHRNESPYKTKTLRLIAPSVYVKKRESSLRPRSLCQRQLKRRGRKDTQRTRSRSRVQHCRVLEECFANPKFGTDARAIIGCCFILLRPLINRKVLC